MIAIHSGEMEVMLDRRLVQDDDRGLGQVRFFCYLKLSHFFHRELKTIFTRRAVFDSVWNISCQVGMQGRGAKTRLDSTHWLRTMLPCNCIILPCLSLPNWTILPVSSHNFIAFKNFRCPNGFHWPSSAFPLRCSPRGFPNSEPSNTVHGFG